MKTRFILYLVLIATLSTSCTNGKQSKDSLPCIDVRKNYLEKEIILTDIADITYLYLNSDNDDYLYQGGICHVTKNTIVVYDESSGNILFFSRDGNPKSYFNRKGQGTEEYSRARIIVYDPFIRVSKEAYNENRLSGKLKELVASLNEEKDNNVFMFVHFK